MRLWPRREKPEGSAESTDTGRELWESEPDPMQAYWGTFGGDAPTSLQPKGPARIYEDEIDPDWHDPWTELDEDDEE